jgi:hypothetical protein
VKIKVPVSTAIAIAIGLVVLSGFFIQIPVLINLRIIFLEWAAILAGVALLLGIYNLLSVHWHKLTVGKQGRFYSLILILSLLATLSVTLLYGPTHPYSLWIFKYIQMPIESSLMAILSIVLAYSCVRLLRRRANPFSIIFVATVLIVLLATGPLLGYNIPGLQELRAWIAQVPATGGARGILLGVALGTIITGLRVIMGVERPYEG